MERAKLVEPGMMYFIDKSLINCKNLKDKYYNFFFNIGTFLLLVIVFGLILYFKYKGKPNKYELEKKNIQKKHYILSRIKNYQDTKKMSKNELITGLPEWNNDYNITQNK
tara:strand:- start:714 stop:1043 length:330 start_codon:yes stop_codon:yes gene_type:complete